MKQPPKLIIISGPSGSGKSTLATHLLKKFPKLEFSISACSRQKRDYETDGVHYYFLSAEAFREKIKNNEFIEWEEVYEDQYYGTLKTEMARIAEKGHHVIFDVDVIGGLRLKKLYGEQALAMIVVPPSLAILKKRLSKRSTENEIQFKKRIEKAEMELEFANQFDRVIINNDLEVSKKEIELIVRKFLYKG